MSIRNKIQSFPIYMQIPYKTLPTPFHKKIIITKTPPSLPFLIFFFLFKYLAPYFISFLVQSFFFLGCLLLLVVCCFAASKKRANPQLCLFRDPQLPPFFFVFIFFLFYFFFLFLLKEKRIFKDVSDCFGCFTAHCEFARQC